MTRVLTVKLTYISGLRLAISWYRPITCRRFMSISRRVSFVHDPSRASSPCITAGCPATGNGSSAMFSSAEEHFFAWWLVSISSAHDWLENRSMAFPANCLLIIFLQLHVKVSNLVFQWTISFIFSLLDVKFYNCLQLQPVKVVNHTTNCLSFTLVFGYALSDVKSWMLGSRYFDLKSRADLKFPFSYK